MDMLCALRVWRFAMPAMKHGYVVPVLEKLPNDERPDETRSAQNKDARHGPIVCATARFRFIARDDSLDAGNRL
jgi:hypothetical protein